MASNTKSDTCWQNKCTKCCLCQAEKREPLTSPIESPARRTEDAYSLVGKNITLFHAVNAIKLHPRRLDDDTGIEATLRKNQALYRTSCKILFNNSKLQRAEKSSTPATDSDRNSGSGNKLPRRMLDPKRIECFLCEEEGNLDDLTEARTMKLNKRL